MGMGDRSSPGRQGWCSGDLPKPRNQTEEPKNLRPEREVEGRDGGVGSVVYLCRS